MSGSLNGRGIYRSACCSVYQVIGHGASPSCPKCNRSSRWVRIHPDRDGGIITGGR